MKRSLLCLGLIFLFSQSFAVLKTWIGTSGASWSVGSNWSPAGAPLSTDDVLINGVTIISMDVNPNINSLYISASGTVELSASALRTITLASSSAITPGLKIDAVSTLKLTQSAASSFKISLTGGIGVTGQIYGTLWLAGSVANATPTLEIGTGPVANGNVTVYSTGIIKCDINSGNTIGYGITGLVMEAGSQYIVLRNGGTMPAGNYKDGSYIRIQGVVNSLFSFNTTANYQGVIEWNCTSQTVNGSSATLSLSSSYPVIDSFIVKSTGSTGTLRLATEMTTAPNINYLRVEGGVLEIASPRSANRTMTINNDLTVAGGSLYLDATDATDIFAVYNVSITVNGNVTVSGGTLILSNRPNGSSSTYGTGNIFCKGDFLQTGGLITEAAPIPPISDASIIYMNGTLAQNLKLTNWTNEVRLSIDNATNGVTLLSNIICPEYLIMNTASAYAILGNYDMLVTYNKFTRNNSGALPARFITNGFGKFKMLAMPASSSMIFPVAYNNSTYNPITIAPQAGAITNDYYARVENGNNPAGIFNVGATVNRTWIINAATPIAANTVNLNFQYVAGDVNGSCNPIGVMELGHFVTGAWSIDPNLIFLTPVLTSVYNVGNFAPNSFDSAFVVGNKFSILALTKTISLTAQKQIEKALLSWQVNNIDNIVSFEIEHSLNGRDYSVIKTFSGIVFKFNEAFMTQGINYFRIKMREQTGRITYSNVATIMYQQDGVKLIAINPTLVEATANVIINSSKQQTIQLCISDLTGKIMSRQSIFIVAGENKIPLNVAGLAGSSYQLTCRTNDGTQLLRFVKK